ncbi:hypothetical protein [Agromyces soli]|uniref:Uncharacterized protein n=1 Tax=Agromyces soli TaxID=659012 RepID=A0ABY4ATX9_9MICO|nr:hypothetical protein [Agromyces soli]UOE26329.1 hypothetical protein MTP13_00695 [Agromyces soli]
MLGSAAIVLAIWALERIPLAEHGGPYVLMGALLLAGIGVTLLVPGLRMLSSRRDETRPTTF